MPLAHDDALPAARTRRVSAWPRRLAAAVIAPLALLVLAVGLLWVSTDVPPPSEVRNPEVSVVLFSDGTEIARTGLENRTAVDLSDVSVAAQQAVLAAEDRGFYEHRAVSPRGIARALLANVRSGEIEQGGSTITQQYARNAFLSRERTLSRKLRETVIALKLEREQSKDELLERYLNTVYFGRGAYGVQAAAETFFGVDAADLTAEQGALLAALLRSPSAYDPAEHPERARDRWAYVLRGMVGQGWLAGPVEARAYPEVRPPGRDDSLAGPHGYLVQHALDELARLGFSRDEVSVGGYRIETTFDRRTQAAAERAVHDVTGPSVPEGVYRALVSVEPGTGRVRAEYGGRDYLTRQLNAVTQGRAPAGSSFKPYVLAAALEEGIPLRRRFDGSSPQTFGGDYEVKNHGARGGADHGRIDLVTATAKSVNTVYVPLGMRAGLSRVADTARALGVTSPIDVERTRASLSLGVTAVTPLEQAVAYATLAAGGRHADPFVVERVLDRDGDVVHAAQIRTEQVVDAAVAADVTFALQQVVEKGTGAAADLPGRPVAGKTGTTSGNTAAWFVGYTPRLSTAVALYTERQDTSLPPLRGVRELTGGSLPARTWRAYSAAVLGGQPALAFPPPVFVDKAERVLTDLTAVAPPGSDPVGTASSDTAPSRAADREPVRRGPTPRTERPTATRQDPATRAPEREPEREPTRRPEPEPEPEPDPEPSEEPDGPLPEILDPPIGRRP